MVFGFFKAMNEFIKKKLYLLGVTGKQWVQNLIFRTKND